ncbi:MAG: hypothetical protein J2P31_05355 [Blastocatellia bacterium]|nr:hypothetical protein [Blastocatellia bacterium]
MQRQSAQLPGAGEIRIQLPGFSRLFGRFGELSLIEQSARALQMLFRALLPEEQANETYPKNDTQLS